MKRSGSLAVEVDPSFHRRMWRIQRAGWFVMGLLLAAALAGVFGGGPISSATAVDRSGKLRIEYERFERQTSPSTLRVHVTQPGSGEEVRVALNRAFVEGIQIQHVTPMPSRVEQRGNGEVYVFRASGDSQLFTFNYQPQRNGASILEVSLPGIASVSSWQFVYP